MRPELPPTRPWLWAGRAPIVGAPAGGAIAAAASAEGLNAFVAIWLNGDRILGYTQPGATLTATLRTGATINGLAVALVDGAGWLGKTAFYAAGRTVDIAPGDTIDLYVNGDRTTVTLPVISGQVDPVTNVVSGTVDVSSPVSLTLQAHGHSRTLTTDASGHYRTDWTGVADIAQDDEVAVAYEVAPGYLAVESVYPQNGYTVYDTWDLLCGYTTPGQTVSVTVRTSGGAIKSTGSVKADPPLGEWIYRAGVDIVAGDRVSVRIGSKALAATTVSAITGAIDAYADAVSGQGPASKPVRVILPARAGTASYLLEQTVAVSAAGRYTVTFPGAIERSGDGAFVTRADTAYADTCAYASAPYAQVDGAWNTVWGYAAPGAQVAVTLTNGSWIRASGVGTANGAGGYQVGLDLKGASPPYIEAGDVVQVQGRGISATIPITDLRVSGHPPTDAINGQGPPSAAHLHASIADTADGIAGQAYEQGGITTTAEGRFNVALPGFDLHDGARGEVLYHAGDDPDGQTQAMQFWTPYLCLNPGSWVCGRAAARPGIPVTLTLLEETEEGPGIRASTVVTQFRMPECWFDAQFLDGGKAIDIEPGNTVLMATRDYTAAVTVAGIDATADPTTDVVSGTVGRPWSVVWVTVDWGQACPYVYVPADGDGHFAAYLGGYHDLQSFDNVQVGVKTASFEDEVTQFRVPGLRLDVNQDHDWVQGETSPGVSVWLTLTDHTGALKGTGEGAVKEDGWFEGQIYTDGRQVDIAPTDMVLATSSDGFGASATVLTMTGRIDAEANTMSGTIEGGTFPAKVLGMVWEKDAPDQVNGTTDAEGRYLLDFSPYDLQKGQQVAVEYFEPDGDGIIIVRNGLCLRVNYGDDWVETNYEPGHRMWITVTDSLGELKAAAAGTTGPIEWWGGQSGFSTNSSGWSSAPPDIVPGDVVSATVDNGDQTSVRVGTITGCLDVVHDTITGTASAPGPSGPLSGWAAVWEEGGPRADDLSFSAEDGYYEWDLGGWDLQAGQNVAVAYRELDGDEVINVFRKPSPDMWVNTWPAGGGQAAPGGPVVYGIECRNQGDAAGEATLTATLPANTTYVGDSSGLPATVGEGIVTWSLGTLDPYTAPLEFYLVLTNTASPGDKLTNHVTVGGSEEINWGNNTSEASVEVSDGQPDLYINKWPGPGDPTPGQCFRYEIGYGNQGPVAGGPVWLTDTLPLSTTFVGLSYEQGNYNYWTEVVTTGGQVVLYSPALPGNWGGRLWLSLRLDEDAPQGIPVTNTVEISTALDANPGDNTCENHDAHTKGPRYDAHADTWWGHGLLVPGAEASFWLGYGNDGNSVLHGVVLTGTVPAGTTFVTSVLDLGWGIEAPFPPDHRSGNQLVWDLGDLPVNASQNVLVRVAIDPGTTPGTVLANEVSISAAEPDHNPYNNAARVEETVRPAGPNLRVTKVGWWNSQNNAYFGLRLCNLGTTTVYDVVVTDALPLSMSLQKWWLDYWDEWHGEEADSQITATLKRLDPGATAWLHISLDAGPGPAGALFTNTARITTPPGDVYPADNQDSFALGRGPDLSVEKRLSGGLPLPGELLTYTLHVANPTPWWPEGEVWVTDTLPAGVEFVRAYERCGADLCTWEPDVQDGRKVAWRYCCGEHRCNPAQAWWWGDIVVVVRIGSTTPAGTRLVNAGTVASAYADDVEPFYANNVSRVTTLVEGRTYLPAILR